MSVLVTDQSVFVFIHRLKDDIEISKIMNAGHYTK